MGANTSLPLPPVKPGFSTMCVSFQYTDRITVLHLDDAGLSIIRQAINETWQSGIKSEKTFVVQAGRLSLMVIHLVLQHLPMFRNRLDRWCPICYRNSMEMDGRSLSPPTWVDMKIKAPCFSRNPLLSFPPPHIFVLG